VVEIVGNKIDLDQQGRRAVSREEGESLASEYQAVYVETTIKDVRSLQNAFERLVQCTCGLI
jgi:hypothetical protein